MNKKREKKCCICGKKTLHEFFLSGINPDICSSTRVILSRCNGCSLIASETLKPKTASHLSQYNADYYGIKRKESLSFKLFQGLFNFERVWRSIKKKDVKSLLDIGCGTGSFLKALPANIRCYGFDTSIEATKVLRKEASPRVIILGKNDIGKRKYDVITMWQSLEHVKDPVKLLCELSSTLSKKGFLYISVPNIMSMQARVFKGSWFHLDPERHRVHYSNESLGILFRRCNLKILLSTTSSFEYGTFGWWQSFFNLLPFDFNMGYKILKRGVRYPVSGKNVFGYTAYILLGLPLAIVSLFLTIFESFFGVGSVLQVKVTRL